MIRVGRIAVKICGGDGLGMVWESSRPIQVIACGFIFGNRYFFYLFDEKLAILPVSRTKVMLVFLIFK